MSSAFAPAAASPASISPAAARVAMDLTAVSFPASADFQPKAAQMSAARRSVAITSS
jgi:hypothetical protein